MANRALKARVRNIGQGLSGDHPAKFERTASAFYHRGKNNWLQHKLKLIRTED